MRILELKNCSKDTIGSMIYSINKQGFDTIQINNDSFDDLKRINEWALMYGIKVILEMNKPNNLSLYGLLKHNIRDFKFEKFNFGAEFITRLEGRTINKIYYDKDYKEILNNFNVDENIIACLSNYDTYKNLSKEELIKYKTFLNSLYFLLTGAYENTLYSPIVENNKMDTSFLSDERIKRANKQLVRRNI